jgi:hypothetical protein
VDKIKRADFTSALLFCSITKLSAKKNYFKQNQLESQNEAGNSSGKIIGLGD